MYTVAYRYSRFFTTVALCLAFVVILLGAYTRLKSAGLGCPDWPGCYGQWVAPQHAEKAWLEMIHRYAAGTLGLCIVALFITAIAMKLREKRYPLWLPLSLVCFVIFQAALGRWTVTWQLLPLVVMGHLLGGMAIFILLAFLRWSFSPKRTTFFELRKYRKPILLGLLLIIFQIALGGWVSSNYAALSCPTFPTCQGSYFPPMNFAKAFHLFSPIGLNYEGGVLDNTARVTIHMAHRFAAFFVAIYLMSLCFFLLRKTKAVVIQSTCFLLLALLLLQISLGIMNVIFLLPLHVAITHNAIAVLLLLTQAYLAYQAIHAK